MAGKVFISTTGHGIARAACSAGGQYEVETLLPGASVRCLAADPLNAGRVYAGTQGRGVLRSDDGGKTWRPAGLDGMTVKALAASPVQGEAVYAGTRPARLYVSHDGGGSWDELRAFRRIRGRRFWFSPAEPPFVAYVQGIGLSPADPARIVVGVEFGATVMSADGGRTWSGHLRGSLRDCHGVAFHPANGDWVYEAGGTGGGAAFSRDGGRTWDKAGAGLDRHYGWSVAGDPADPATWYVSVAPGPAQAHGENDAQAAIFRREGHGWRKLAVGPSQPLAQMPYALIADREAPGSLYAGLGNGDVWHSPDRGDHWLQLPVSLGAVRQALVML